MLVFTMHAGICAACLYLQCMLIFALHAGIYDACWYLRCMLVFTMHVDICAACWYLRWMLVFALHAGIYDACWYLAVCMLAFTLLPWIYKAMVVIHALTHCEILTSYIMESRNLSLV